MVRELARSDGDLVGMQQKQHGKSNVIESAKTSPKD
jgi:hypothetical protein